MLIRKNDNEELKKKGKITCAVTSQVCRRHMETSFHSPPFLPGNWFFLVVSSLEQYLKSTISSQKHGKSKQTSLLSWVNPEDSTNGNVWDENVMWYPQGLGRWYGLSWSRQFICGRQPAAQAFVWKAFTTDATFRHLFNLNNLITALHGEDYNEFT